MSHNLTASDRACLIRLASSLPKGSPERKAILAGLEKRADPLPTTVSLQELEARDNYRVLYPVNFYMHPLSEHPGSVFYLNDDGYMFVVLAKRKKALVNQYKVKNVWEALFDARSIKSFGACLKENADAIEMNREPPWKEIRVLP